MHLKFADIIYIVKGIGVTLSYASCSVLFGIVVATILTIFSFSHIKLLKLFSKLYVSIFRGTPLLVQLSIVYFGIPGLTGYKMPTFLAGVIAFSLNSGAYISEVIRAGVNSIDKGQFEAAKTLGIPYHFMMRDIILPQALSNILPALVNELIDMLKESSLISVIGEADLMRRAQIIASQNYIYFSPLITAAICYYCVIIILSFLAKQLEKKLHNDYY
ncbi:MAG: amino acid ABC transporter permease [Rickettsiales endosymbiont of Dermacentor nuttalli]